MLLGCGDEQVERRKAAQAGLNETHATIMDTSANKLLKALNRLSHACGTGAPAFLTALSLALAGCSVLQPGTTARLIPPSRAGTEGAHEQAPVTVQPEAPSKPAQPVPQPTPATISEIRETKPPPATVSKGAEKLVAPNTPLVVRARERTPPPAEPSAPKAPTAEVSGTVTDAPVQALVFRGPPPQAPSSRTGMKVLVWFGLAFGGAALAVVGRVWLVRRAKPAGPADAKKDELKMPPELLFKEPLNLPQEVVMAEKP